MAITINSIPQLFSPSDNPLTYVFESDQTTQVNFSFSVDVRIGGVVTTTHTLFPENGDIAHFDIQEIIKSSIDIPALIMSAISEDANNYTSISINPVEKYGTPPTLQGGSVSSTTYAFKSRLDDLDWIDFDYTNKYFLTDFPQTEENLVGYNDDVRLLVLNNATADIITVELFDSSGVSITSDTFTLSASDRISQLDLKPATIVANTTITQANFDSAAYYEISTNAVGVTDTVKFYMNALCGLYDTYRIIFMSRIGNWEAYTFNLLSRKTTQTNSIGYKKSFGKYSGSDYVYTKDNGRQVDYQTSSIDSLLVNSDWIKEDVQNWLIKNLYESPAVYIQDGSDYIRVNVKNKGGEQKKRVNDMLFNEVLELEYSNSRKSMLL